MLGKTQENIVWNQSLNPQTEFMKYKKGTWLESKVAGHLCLVMDILKDTQKYKIKILSKGLEWIVDLPVGHIEDDNYFGEYKHGYAPV